MVARDSRDPRLAGRYPLSRRADRGIWTRPRLLDPDGTHAPQRRWARIARRDAHGDVGERARAPRSSRSRATTTSRAVVVRPRIDDGAARARRTREPGRVRARLLAPAVTRAHAPRDERHEPR